MTVDLSASYLSLKLKNPLVVSACPLTSKLASLQQLEQAGAAAVVLPSLFVEQIEHDELEIFRLHELAGESVAESPSYFPELQTYNTGPEPHLEFLAEAKRHLAIPVIASLNGAAPGSWVRYAKLFENAGADAVELNIYAVPIDPAVTAQQVEEDYCRIVAAVAGQLSIPLSVKIGSQFSSLPNFAARLIAAGAQGLVLFNRYLEPEIDIEQLRVEPHLELSTPAELRSALRWIGILRDQLSCSLAATSGIHSVAGVLKALLVGANVTMLASTLLKQGPQQIAELLVELERWLEQHRYHSVEQLVGSMSRNNSADTTAFERANYMKALVRYTQIV